MNKDKRKKEIYLVLLVPVGNQNKNSITPESLFLILFEKSKTIHFLFNSILKLGLHGLSTNKISIVHGFVSFKSKSLHQFDLIYPCVSIYYSIVKDSNADLTVGN